MMPKCRACKRETDCESWGDGWIFHVCRWCGSWWSEKA